MHHHHDDRTRAKHAGRNMPRRKLIIHVTVALVSLLSGVAGGVEIADDFATCVEYDD